jgi:hypothetical protein
MAQICTICTHENRERIEEDLISGRSIRQMAAQYGVSYSSIRYHKAHHLPKLLVQAHEVQEIARADHLINKLHWLSDTLTNLMQKAEEIQDYRTAIAGAAPLRQVIETLLEVAGELDRQTTINIELNPYWQETRAAILNALAPYPEAKTAVIEALFNVQRRKNDRLR